MGHQLLLLALFCTCLIGINSEMTTDNPDNEDLGSTTEDLTQMPSTTATTKATTTQEQIGYTCGKGDPENPSTTTCTEGCFGSLEGGTAKIGCLSDFDFEDLGFGSVSSCTTDGMGGVCIDYGSGEDKVENCMRCCKSTSCNEVYKEKCDYLPTSDDCDEDVETTTAGASNLRVLAGVLVSALALYLI